jgi:hypothetical protein
MCLHVTGAGLSSSLSSLSTPLADDACPYPLAPPSAPPPPHLRPIALLAGLLARLYRAVFLIFGSLNNACDNCMSFIN